MTVAANQPYFLPYLPYWQLISAADVFLIADDYSFRRSSWINRNIIQIEGKPLWMCLELKHQSSYKLIGETEILQDISPNKMETIRRAYKKAPFFEAGYAIAEKILSNPERNLSLFLEYSIRIICDYLGISTRIMHTSDFPGNALLKKEQRIYDFCHRMEADTYVNAIGGMSLYDFDAFRQEGLRLRFIHSGCREQRSILDTIMNHSQEELRDMLNNYSFIDG